MAEVFEVEDDGGERFALKLLNQQGSAVPRFAREYEALIRLNHPNIVRVYNYGLHGSQPWMTMELLNGTALQTHLKAMGRPGDVGRTNEVIRVGSVVAEALQYIHSRGLVHRDLKSDNVVILPDGRVKLLDFGTAHITDALQKITRPGEFIGTFVYAAPEQLAGLPIDRRADLYAFGVLLYRLTTGQRPFEADDPLTLARLHSSVDPRPPRELVPDMPQKLEETILHLLQKRPEKRPARAADVARILRELGKDVPLRGAIEVTANPELAIGRDTELLDVLGLLETGGPGTAVIVEGAEGSNRLRFVRSVAQTLQKRNWMTFSVTLREDKAGQDLVGMLDHVAELFHRTDRPEGRAAVEILRQQVDPSSLDTKRRASLAKAAGLLVVSRARAESRSVLLAIQGLNHAGPAELELLQQVRADAMRASVQVKVVAGIPSDILGFDQMLDRYLPGAHHRVLEPLTLRAVGTTVATLLHRRLPPVELARRVLNASGGQPLFVEEVVRSIVERGALEVRGQGGNRVEWALKARDIPMAPSARSAMDKVLRRTPHAWLRVLEALAVAGEEASLTAVAAVFDWTEEDIEPIADRLVARGWLCWEDVDGRRWLAWQRQLVRTLLLESIPPFRRIFLARSLARSLDPECTSPTRVRLLLAYGSYAEAARIAPAAADRLVHEGDPGQAAELLQDTVTLVEAGVEEDARAELLLDLTTCLLQVRPTDPAVPRSLSQAEKLAHDATLKARVAMTRARLQLVIGHYRNHRKFLLEAWEQAKDGDLGFAGVIACQIARVSHWGGQPKTAVEWFDRAWKLAEASQDDAVIAQVAGSRAAFLLSRGELTASFAEAEMAVAAYDRASLPRDGGIAIASWANGLRFQGRFSEALTRLYGLLHQLRAAESPSDHVEVLLAIAHAEVGLFRLGKAQEALDELDSVVRPGELLHLRLEARLVRGKIALASGQYPEAAEELRQAHERARAAELVGLAEHARALHAETLWEINRKNEAREEFRAAGLGLLGTGDQLSLAEACAARARALGDEEDPEQLFAPVKELLDREPVETLRMERHLAMARYAAARGGAFTAWRDAATHLNRMAKFLDEVDRSALRVHPWSRAIVRGLS